MCLHAKNKKVIVTGAASGIGKEIVTQCLEEKFPSNILLLGVLIVLKFI